MVQRFLFFFFLCISNVFCAMAQGEANSVPEAPKEDFVKASILVASPGEVMYSTLGHACLRLQCPDHKLDYVFSSEAEDVSNNLVSFFAGKLMMGVRAVPTQEYVNQYSEQGRGVKEYQLHLPIQVKQRLWQQMDERLEYADQPYDYMNQGCAVSVLSWLEDAIDTDSLTYAPWPERYEKTRKELAADSIQAPWVHILLSIIIGGEANDADVRYPNKLLVPNDLVNVLSQAKAYGRPLLDSTPTTLLKQTKELNYTWFTPNVLAIIFLLIAIANLFIHKALLRWPILVLGAATGCLLLYLTLLSHLPCTEWNWLLVPFFPLPIVGWKWRRYWALPYAAICALWCVAMLLYPHQLVDTSLVIFASAIAITYFEVYKHQNKIN